MPAQLLLEKRKTVGNMPATLLLLGWHDISQQLFNHGAAAAAGWMTAAPKQLLAVRFMAALHSREGQPVHIVCSFDAAKPLDCLHACHSNLRVTTLCTGSSRQHVHVSCNTHHIELCRAATSWSASSHVAAQHFVCMQAAATFVKSMPHAAHLEELLQGEEAITIIQQLKHGGLPASSGCKQQAAWHA
jgi:hypothetical protein